MLVVVSVVMVLTSLVSLSYISVVMLVVVVSFELVDRCSYCRLYPARVGEVVLKLEVKC